MPSLRIKRGTRSAINTAAGSSLLNAGEPYLITDENRIAIGLTATTYESFAKLSEAGGGGSSNIDGGNASNAGSALTAIDGGTA